MYYRYTNPATTTADFARARRTSLPYRYHYSSPIPHPETETYLLHTDICMCI